MEAIQSANLLQLLDQCEAQMDIQMKEFETLIGQVQGIIDQLSAGSHKAFLVRQTIQNVANVVRSNVEQ